MQFDRETLAYSIIIGLQVFLFMKLQYTAKYHLDLYRTLMSFQAALLPKHLQRVLEEGLKVYSQEYSVEKACEAMSAQFTIEKRNAEANDPSSDSV